MSTQISTNKRERERDHLTFDDIPYTSTKTAIQEEPGKDPARMNRRTPTPALQLLLCLEAPPLAQEALQAQHGRFQAQETLPLLREDGKMRQAW